MHAVAQQVPHPATNANALGLTEAEAQDVDAFVDAGTETEAKPKRKQTYFAVILVGDGVCKRVQGAKKKDLEQAIAAAGATDVLWTFKGYEVQATRTFKVG